MKSRLTLKRSGRLWILSCKAGKVEVLFTGRNLTEVLHQCGLAKLKAAWNNRELLLTIEHWALAL